MKTRIAFVAGIAGSLFASSAFAQEAAVSTSVAPKLSAGAQLEILPGGSGHVEAEANGETFEEDFDFDVAYGVAANFDYAVTPNISVGFAPRIVLNIIPKDAADSDDPATQYDLRLRVKAQFPVAPQLNVYGYVAPGYSILSGSGSEDEETEIDDPAGLVIAGALGATYDISPNLFASAELGYQMGFQGTEVAGTDVEFSTSLFHVGIGVGTRF